VTAPRTLKEARTVVVGLRELGATAPDGLDERVMVATGLVDAYAEVAGPIGPLYVAWGPHGIMLVERAGDPMGFELDHALRTGRQIRRVDTLPAGLARAVEKRLAGEPGSRPDDVPVDLASLTAFEQAVLRKTMEIPAGEVRPYAWVAREVGRPRAVRAVGSALAGNPIPFIIPCHRVVRTDGHIGEYGAGGPEAKWSVLESEGLDPAELERLATAGIRYLGSDTTRIFCYPSCRHARRITAPHRVPFRDGSDAGRAGYRACRDCRPLVASPFAA
jgi:O-6-methylguanine DNA methyltransferase